MGITAVLDELSRYPEVANAVPGGAIAELAAEAESGASARLDEAFRLVLQHRVAVPFLLRLTDGGRRDPVLPARAWQRATTSTAVGPGAAQGAARVRASKTITLFRAHAQVQHELLMPSGLARAG